jgi:hypothetical protein
MLMSADGVKAPVEVVNEVTENEQNKLSRKDGAISPSLGSSCSLEVEGSL